MKNKIYLLFLLLIISLVYLHPVFAQQTTESNTTTTQVGTPPTGGAGGTPGPGAPGSFVFYCQGDPRWNSPNYNCHMAAAGCGPTSMAMILSTFGEPMTPKEVDQIFQTRTWRSCAGVGSQMETAVTTLLPEKGYTVIKINSGGQLKLKEAQEYLDDKFYIIGSTLNHIFVIDGVNEVSNQVHMRDPARCGEPGGSYKPNAAPWAGEGWFYAYAVKKR